MVELIAFIVIVGIALAGIIGVMNRTTTSSVDPMRRKQALMVAESLMEEVMQAGFTLCDPADANYSADSTLTSANCASVPEVFGPEAGNVRPFDNVNDYVLSSSGSYATFGGVGAILDVNGGALAGTGYGATIQITQDGTLGPSGSTVPSAEALHITITVTYDSGQSVVLDGYRTRFAPRGK